MKRKTKLILRLAPILLMLLIAPEVRAAQSGEQESYLQEQARASGADTLPQALDPETREELSSLGAQSAVGYTGFSAQKLLSSFFEMLLHPGREPLEAGAKLLLLLFLCAVICAFAPGEGARAAQLCAAAGAAVILFLPLSDCISEAMRVMRSAGGFIAAAAPVYTALLAANGRSLAASSYQYITLLSGNFITLLANGAATPLLRIFLGLSAAAPLAAESPLPAFLSGFSKAIKVILALWMTVFSAILALTNAASAGGEAVLAKAAKYASTAFVPVVGSAVGDAAGAILGSVSALRGGAGAFGVLAIAVIYLPMLAKCVLWLCCCTLFASLAESLSLPQLAAVLRGGKQASELLLALLVSSMVVLTVCCGVVAAGRSTA